MKGLGTITAVGVVLVLLGATPELGIIYELAQHIGSVVPLPAFFIPIVVVWFVKATFRGL